MTKLRVLSLFAGIGGFDLGLERTGGFETVAFCEIDPFCRRVLAKHWPEVPCYHDVRELTADRLRADGVAVDVICGGFPCQDISVANRDGQGLAGKRSGLWSEVARLADEIRPAFILLENVSALLGRGLGVVLGDLAAIGYDAEWHCLPASAVGAPHYRDRFWLVAYADRVGVRGSGCRPASRPTSEDGGKARQQRLRADPQSSSEDLADADDAGRVEQWRSIPIRTELATAQRRGGWSPEPSVGRVANGIPNRVDRLRALGNAVVPQVVELIGRAILASLDEESAAA